ncbi:MAG: alpha/beta hydrolase [Candidatus Lokiarchaeota archaeon]|nr:alpha/beta hydrolase [Candidatus Lokiarchaeota archaeon]
MEQPDYSHLRADLAKALKVKDSQFNNGLKLFAEQEKIPLDQVLQKFQTQEDSLFVVKAHRFVDDYMQNLTPRPSNVNFQRETIGSILVEWILPKKADETGLILYFHGGGYVFGSLDARWKTPTRLSTIIKKKILSVNYSHAPEHPYPAALEDAVFVYNYLLDQMDIDPKTIIIAGSSAGGGLALALLLKLRDEDKNLPAGTILFSPWTDLTFTGPSLFSNKQSDPDIREQDLRLLAAAYYANHSPQDPYISPLYGNFRGLPPLLLDAGELEILLDDSARLVENAQKAGVNIQFKKWKDMIHVFHNLYEYIPESDQAFQRVVEFLSKILS